MLSGLREKVLLRRAYAPRLPRDFAATPKKQFNAPFLDSAKLAEDFDADNILAVTGLNDQLPLHRLQVATHKARQDDPYVATHLRSACQTALAASIVNKTIVQGGALQRDDALDKAYLDESGPAR